MLPGLKRLSLPLLSHSLLFLRGRGRASKADGLTLSCLPAGLDLPFSSCLPPCLEVKGTYLAPHLTISSLRTSVRPLTVVKLAVRPLA